MKASLLQQRRSAAAILLLACLCSVALGATQTVSVSPPRLERQVVRLRVRPKVGDTLKPLGRKRFFLVRGGLEENRQLVETLKQTRVLARDCYYRQIGASEALRAWLKTHDCESVYCREAATNDVEGEAAVPEFRAAYASGRREFGSRQLALKWLTVNLREEIRSGFYRRRQATLAALVRQAEANSKAKVASVMTDSKGTAYFTDLEPGTYLISNLVPAELGDRALLWNCEIKIKAGSHGAETPYLISNQKDKNVKCLAVEQPLPACEF